MRPRRLPLAVNWNWKLKLNLLARIAVDVPVRAESRTTQMRYQILIAK